MEENAIDRAMKQLASAADTRSEPAAFDAALERARSAIEELAATTAQLEAGLPEAILFGMLAQESGGKVHAVSRSGASGMAASPMRKAVKCPTSV